MIQAISTSYQIEEKLSNLQDFQKVAIFFCINKLQLFGIGTKVPKWTQFPKVTVYLYRKILRLLGFVSILRQKFQNGNKSKNFYFIIQKYFETFWIWGKSSKMKTNPKSCNIFLYNKLQLLGIYASPIILQTIQFDAILFEPCVCIGKDVKTR